MADKEHLRILRGGVDRWNQWRQKNPDLQPDLSDANLSEANLFVVNFRNANLRTAYLSDANLRSANLHSADLRDAYLSDANLSNANLSNAKLSGAVLKRTQAPGANFQKADLTGITIEDWNISSTKKLDDVICKYIFFKEVRQERRSSDCTKTFAPGDFAKLVQKSLETVDLIFSNGIDWKAFFQSFGDLQVEYGDRPIFIQAIENKNDGTFVIRLNVPPDLDKGAIKRQAMKLYETKRLELEAWYRSTLHLKDEQIEDLRQHNKDLMELARLKPNQPIQNYINSNVTHQHGQGDNFGGDRIQGNKVIGDRDETSER
ncbi:MAG: pentapeptide repeat-containing protein [Leptolyngbyaceae cyanobacterium SM1_3_5]|nr:pentapeptide repeat-containing protein [Leptolyngbyaceae cyanobacterium SM1_3_5]